jgi:hypothetical protein
MMYICAPALRRSAAPPHYRHKSIGTHVGACIGRLLDLHSALLGVPNDDSLLGPAVQALREALAWWDESRICGNVLEIDSMPFYLKPCSAQKKNTKTL